MISKRCIQRGDSIAATRKHRPPRRHSPQRECTQGSTKQNEIKSPNVQPGKIPRAIQSTKKNVIIQKAERFRPARPPRGRRSGVGGANGRRKTTARPPNLPAGGLKETAALSVFRPPTWSGLPLREEGDTLEGQALQAGGPMWCGWLCACVSMRIGQ